MENNPTVQHAFESIKSALAALGHTVIASEDGIHTVIDNVPVSIRGNSHSVWSTIKGKYVPVGNPTITVYSYLFPRVSQTYRCTAKGYSIKLIVKYISKNVKRYLKNEKPTQNSPTAQPTTIRTTSKTTTTS